MSRPIANNGNTLTDIGWGIYDAGLFHINDSEKYHIVSSFPTGVTVRGKCGVMASTSEDPNSRRASWASGYTGTLCPTCKDA